MAVSLTRNDPAPLVGRFSSSSAAAAKRIIRSAGPGRRWAPEAWWRISQSRVCDEEVDMRWVEWRGETLGRQGSFSSAILA